MEQGHGLYSKASNSSLKYLFTKFNAVALLSSLLPLSANVGRNLEYEYLWLAGLIALFSLTILPVFESKQKTSFCLRRHLLIPSLIFVLIPILLFGSKQCLCNPQQFYFWFFSIWLPSWLTGLCLYYFQINKKNSTTAWKTSLTVVAAAALVTLVEFSILFFYPQKRMVSFFAGFLHGPIYDDFISVSYSVVALQWLQVVVLTITLYVMDKKLKPTTLKLPLAIFISFLISLCFTNLSPNIASSTGHGLGPLNKIMDQTHDAKGFKVHFSKKLQKDSPEKIQLLIKETAFHFQDLLDILKIKPKKPIEIYIYDDIYQKKLFFGGAHTDITDIRTPSVHTTLKSYPHPTMRHELVHAILSQVGFYGLGFHPNMAITEGIAVALAPTHSAWTLNELATSFLSEQDTTRLRRVFSVFFWLENPEISYTLAGAFIQNLIEVHGITPALQLYHGASFQKAFQKPFTELQTEWQQSLKNTVDPAKVKQILFKAKQLRPAFADTCPHSKAIQERNSFEFLDYVRTHPKRTAAAGYWQWRLQMQPNNLYIKSRSLRTQAFKDSKSTAIRAAENILKNADNIFYQIELQDLLKDIHLVEGNKPKAHLYIEKLLNKDLRGYLSASLLRKTLLQKEMLLSPSPLHDKWLTFLFYPFENNEQFYGQHGYGKLFSDLGTKAWPHQYLLLRNRPQAITNSALDQLTNVKPSNHPQIFDLEWHRLLAEEYTRRQKYQKALNHYQIATSLAEGSLKENMMIQQRFIETF